MHHWALYQCARHIYLRTLFEGWSPEVHDILGVTKESEIEQRDLYDRPPSVFKPWTKGHVALLGDAIHAMMPNLGQVSPRPRPRPSPKKIQTQPEP